MASLCVFVHPEYKYRIRHLEKEKGRERDIGGGGVPGKLVGLIGGDLAEARSPSSLPPIANGSQLVSVFSPPFLPSPPHPAHCG